jgi:hypothetical protein
MLMSLKSHKGSAQMPKRTTGEFRRILLPKSPSKASARAQAAVEVEYELVYSARKSIGINIYPDTRVVVRAPHATDLARVEDILHARADWILRHRQRFANRTQSQSTTPRYVNGETVRYLGKVYRLQIEQAARARVMLQEAASAGGEGVLIVQTATPDQPRQVEKLVKSWYARQAERVFAERLSICFEAIRSWKVAYPELAMRQMRSRWGSCTSKGKVTLNLRLIQAPLELIDYVIYHELCHLREMNHSPAFYTLMVALCPRWKSLKKQLNTYPFSAD